MICTVDQGISVPNFESIGSFVSMMGNPFPNGEPVKVIVVRFFKKIVVYYHENQFPVDHDVKKV